MVLRARQIADLGSEAAEVSIDLISKFLWNDFTTLSDLAGLQRSHRGRLALGVWKHFVLDALVNYHVTFLVIVGLAYVARLEGVVIFGFIHSHLNLRVSKSRNRLFVFQLGRRSYLHRSCLGWRLNLARSHLRPKNRTWLSVLQVWLLPKGSEVWLPFCPSVCASASAGPTFIGSARVNAVGVWVTLVPVVFLLESCHCGPEVVGLIGLAHIVLGSASALGSQLISAQTQWRHIFYKMREQFVHLRTLLDPAWSIILS